MTWVFEVAFALLLTLELLPVLLLYGLDLAAGMIAPEAEIALGALTGIIGLWLALISSDELMRRQPVLRWASVTTLTLAAVVGIYLVRGFTRAGGGIAWAAGLTGAGSATVAVHQLTRLIRL